MYQLSRVSSFCLQARHHTTTQLLYIFFFNDTPTTEIYTLSLHDALPISSNRTSSPARTRLTSGWTGRRAWSARRDRKSTRLNSSHANISYAVFCLKKKKNDQKQLK